MLEAVKGEVEAHLAALQSVRAELAPWEAQIAGAQARVDVATAERELVLKKQTDAEDQLKVRSELSPLSCTHLEATP